MNTRITSGHEHADNEWPTSKFWLVQEAYDLGEHLAAHISPDSPASFFHLAASAATVQHLEYLSAVAGHANKIHLAKETAESGGNVVVLHVRRRSKVGLELPVWQFRCQPVASAKKTATAHAHEHMFFLQARRREI